MTGRVRNGLQASADVIGQMLCEDALIAEIDRVAERCVTAFKAGRKILLAGNGGSAADAQHLAGEFVSRFAFDRPGLPAFALTTDTSVLTAIGNDYGYDKLFSRQVQAVAVGGDVFFGISTSGRSRNVLNALEEARSRGLVTVGFTGRGGGAMTDLCDHVICAPSTVTPRIQECHIVIGHLICGLVEETLFSPPR